jgi:hypothetical protein
MKILLTLFILNISQLSLAQKHKSKAYLQIPDTLLQSKQSSQKSNNVFFQGIKWFCCDYRKGKYKLSIKGNEITITLIYSEKESTVKGIIKNGKIYSDDRMEKMNKSLAGKVYQLKNDRFHVLTGEGGEYDEYYACKQ